MTDDVLLTILIVLPFVGSLLAATFRPNARNSEAWLAGGVALICLFLLVFAYPAIVERGVLRSEAEWIPALGLSFTLRLDGFAWMFALLVTGIGFLVVLYARYYMSPNDPVPRFFSFLLAFMGSMLGIVIAGNLIILLFFWELTSIFSFLLIGYWHHTAGARDGARMALVVTGFGGVALLAGVVLIGQIVGSYDLDQVLASGEAIRSHVLYLPALVLILLGTLTKSAQFPFHFWLPNAMAAPTPVSALLHSATMVKAGVFPADAPVASHGRDARMVLAPGTRRHGGASARRLLRHLPARPQGTPRLLDDQPSRPDHHAAQSRQPAGRRRRHLPHDEPRDLQGLAVHGGRHHRSRDRHARHAQAGGAVPLHACHRHPGDGGERRHGGRTAPQWVPVEGNVLRRGDRDPRPLAARHLPALCRGAGQHLRRDLFAALHPFRVLRRQAPRPATRAARAAVLDARPQHVPGAGLPGGRHLSGGDRRPLPAHGRAVGAGFPHAGLQSGHLARVQPAPDHEHGGSCRRGAAVPRAQELPAAQPGGTARAAAPEWPPSVRTGRDRPVPQMVAGRRDGIQHAPPAAPAADSASGGRPRGVCANLDGQPRPARTGLERPRSRTRAGLAGRRRLRDRRRAPGPSIIAWSRSSCWAGRASPPASPSPGSPRPTWR